MIPAVTWLGVDVGGERKGFDAALIDERRLLDLNGGLTHAEILTIVRMRRPAVVAIDSPRCCAPHGERTRAGERRVHNEICGIRWTPDASQVRGNPYYEWIEHGLELYRGLEGCGAQVIEVFPTASWTRWAGKRGRQSRSQWSTQALALLGLEGIPSRTNQDQRDAIAAAVTAREHSQV
jgi:predicted nuclease with RNAse H fold